MHVPILRTIVNNNRSPHLFYFLTPIFFQAIFRFMNWFSAMDQLVDKLSLRYQVQNDTFDFIVVGAGVTGSVLANKLSQSYNVLLLEAGGSPSPHLKLPILAYLMLGKEPQDWSYSTVPQDHSCMGLENNIVKWPAGKGLGGSSLINGMIYVRGTVQGFDAIANQTNDPIWSMKNTLKYYTTIEDYEGHFDDGSHGKTGKMSIGPGFQSSYMRNFEGAAKELGMEILDPNSQGPVREGFSPMDLYTKNGRRWSTYNGYIAPIINSRRNYVVRKYSYVYKVLLDDTNQKAIGVEYIRHGEIIRAYATKEVILSAGAIQSPKILMLSGIGPKGHLESIGIQGKHNLPVGETLQDKYGALIGPFMLKPESSTILPQIFRPRSYINWLSFGAGELSTSLTEATYTIHSNISKKDSATSTPPMVNGNGRNTVLPPLAPPDIHTYIISSPIDDYVNDILFHGSFNFKKDTISKYFGLASGHDSFMQLVTLAKPHGYGSIRLKDSNPNSPPIIDPNYLTNQRDFNVLVEGIKYAVHIVEGTLSFKELGPSLLSVPFPGCEDVEFRSHDYWGCVARHTTATAYKYGGSAPIGSVVDSRLKVIGLRGLRVIDGSVLLEKYVSVNHVTCIMLGELASDFILQEYSTNNHNL